MQRLGSKAEVMTHRSHLTQFAPSTDSGPAEDGSHVRERAAPSLRPNRESDPNLSLDQRLESKLATAQALLLKLEPQDARARLLHIAMLRRDEALLEGILAELGARGERA